MENQTGTLDEWVLFVGTSMMLLLASAVIGFIYLYQRKLIKRKLAYQEIENLLRHQELKSAYALLEGQDMERQRIAEEIHDNLGSILVTLSMYTEAFEKASTPEDKQNLATKISKMTQQAAEEARKISHRMDAGALHQFGLQAAIQDLLGAINSIENIQLIANVDLSENPTNEIGLNMYRVLQELINNTLKHAHAKTITLDISQVNDEYISFIYEDDGIGLKKDVQHSAGMGLRNIVARIEKLQGTISFEEKPTRGFSVVIEIPLA
jgi:signal transduction histidine kinase